ncbi:hypothetical protein, partial [Massilia genomosp. 1]|uniref:hypothetical protein n=1 Tax=Massilia genomosp. 1 TaxID=2609280 RepID=UPI001C9E5CA1
LFRGGKLGKIWKGAQFCHDQHHGPISRNEQLWHVLAQAKQLPSINMPTSLLYVSEFLLHVLPRAIHPLHSHSPTMKIRRYFSD